MWYTAVFPDRPMAGLLTKTPWMRDGEHMFKVMIRDSMSPVAREILEATGQVEVVVDNDKTTNDPDRLAEIPGIEPLSFGG